MIVAIDGNNWYHVLWHGMHGEGVTDEFLRRLQTIANTWRPSILAVAFDSTNSFRKKLSPEYKANRKTPDPGLVEGLAELPSRIAEQGKATCVSADGFEGDDVLATIANHAVQSGQKCVLCTSDKDVRQCLVPGFVTICREFRISFGEIQPAWMTADSFTEEFGLQPSQWRDYQALVGDPTDGITGCPKIGDVTARKLLREKGTLLEIMANPQACPCSEKQRESLIAFSTRVKLVLDLVTLRRDVPGILEVL